MNQADEHANYCTRHGLRQHLGIWLLDDTTLLTKSAVLNFLKYLNSQGIEIGERSE